MRILFEIPVSPLFKLFLRIDRRCIILLTISINDKAVNRRCYNMPRKSAKCSPKLIHKKHMGFSQVFSQTNIMRWKYPELFSERRYQDRADLRGMVSALAGDACD